MRDPRRIALWLVAAWLLVAAPCHGAALPLLACAPELDAAALVEQRDAVRSRLQAIEARQTARLAVAVTDAEVDAASQAYRRERWAALTPLTALGNAEAMARLANDLRDDDQPEEIRTWFALADCAARLGHPFANDEMARFWWHQKGDGSMADIQANRSRALDHADRAARVGPVGAMMRIAVYIAGDLHQYPADRALARRLMELCARTDAADCQSAIVARAPYDYGQDAADDAFWLQRLAARDVNAFGARRDRAWAALSEVQRAAVSARLAAWRPLTWAEAASDWATIRSEILAHGALSAGAPSVCATQTPWCRGAALRTPAN